MNTTPIPIYEWQVLAFGRDNSVRCQMTVNGKTLDFVMHFDASALKRMFQKAVCNRSQTTTTGALTLRVISTGGELEKP